MEADGTYSHPPLLETGTIAFLGMYVSASPANREAYLTAKKAPFPRVAKVCQMDSGKLVFWGNQYVTHILLTPAM